MTVLATKELGQRTIEGKVVEAFLETVEDECVFCHGTGARSCLNEPSRRKNDDLFDKVNYHKVLCLRCKGTGREQYDRFYTKPDVFPLRRDE